MNAKAICSFELGQCRTGSRRPPSWPSLGRSGHSRCGALEQRGVACQGDAHTEGTDHRHDDRARQHVGTDFSGAGVGSS